MAADVRKLERTMKRLVKRQQQNNQLIEDRLSIAAAYQGHPDNHMQNINAAQMYNVGVYQSERSGGGA